jgi:hypothetical protein
MCGAVVLQIAISTSAHFLVYDRFTVELIKLGTVSRLEVTLPQQPSCEVQR